MSDVGVQSRLGRSGREGLSGRLQHTAQQFGQATALRLGSMWYGGERGFPNEACFLRRNSQEFTHWASSLDPFAPQSWCPLLGEHQVKGSAQPTRHSMHQDGGPKPSEARQLRVCSVLGWETWQLLSAALSSVMKEVG